MFEMQSLSNHRVIFLTPNFEIDYFCDVIILQEVNTAYEPSFCVKKASRKESAERVRYTILSIHPYKISLSPLSNNQGGNIIT